MDSYWLCPFFGWLYGFFRYFSGVVLTYAKAGVAIKSARAAGHAHIFSRFHPAKLARRVAFWLCPVHHLLKGAELVGHIYT